MNSEISVLIIEDEELWAMHIESVLADHGFHICGVKDNIEDALLAFQSLQYDIVLLDIGLNGRNSGLQLGKLLADQYKKPYIFVSSISDTDLLKQAVEAGPSAYLFKPATNAAIYTSIQLALQHFTESTSPAKEDGDRGLPDSFFVKLGASYKRVSWRDVVYLTTEGNYTRLFTQDGNEFLLHSSLQKTLQNAVPQSPVTPGFIQVNRAEAVHWPYIREIKGDTIITPLRSFVLKEAFGKEVKKKLNILT